MSNFRSHIEITNLITLVKNSDLETIKSNFNLTEVGLNSI